MASKIALSYPEELAQAGFPSPAVELEFEGQKAWFLVDTGASTNVFASWFTQEIATALAGKTKEIKVPDSTGTLIPMRIHVGLRGRANGTNVELREVMVAPFPPDFAAARIAGILSPQLLAPEGLATVIDLHAGVLTFEPWAQALSRLGALGLQRDDRRVRVCSSPRAPVENLLFGVPVIVDGIALNLLLDTGAATSKLFESTLPATFVPRLVASKKKEAGLAGKAKPVRILPNSQLQVGPARRSLDLKVGAGGSGCGKHGLLGLDGMKPCIFVLGTEDVAVWCPREN